MKYNIYAIGNMRRSPEAEIFLKYSKRIKNIEFFEYVSNFDEKNKKINDESKKLLSMIKNNGKKILLDEKGKILSSFEFSKLISDWRNYGHNIINFFRKSKYYRIFFKRRSNFFNYELFDLISFSINS